MTGTALKDVRNSCTEFPMMDLPGKTTQAQDTSFRDKLSKETDLRNGKKTDHASDAVKTRNGKRSNQSDALQKGRIKQLRVSEDTTEPAEEGNQITAEEAIAALVTEIADTFSVSSEEVFQTMELLGMSAEDLLNQESLSALMLQMAGEEDSFSLVLNENLYEGYQKVMDKATTLLQALDQPVVEESELQRSSQTQETKGLVDMEDGNDAEAMAGLQDKQQINPTKGEATGKQKGNSQEGKPEGNAEALFQADTTVRSTADMETSSIGYTNQTADTTNIMRQILDFIKVEMHPELNKLTMQLHPESLGTVQVQLISRQNGVTAQFITQNEAVKAVLETQMIQLEESLREQGMKVAAIEVSVDPQMFHESFEENSQERERENFTRRGRNRRTSMNGMQLDGENANEIAENIPTIGNGNTIDYMA